MNKFSIFLSFCLIFLLFSSCAPDYTEEVEWAYDAAKNNYASGCQSNLDCPMGYVCNTEKKTCTTSEQADNGGDTESEDSCTTIDGNMWSPMASSYMNWSDAVSYCDSLTACGYSDWHLPTISELRTLIKNCPGSQAGGVCAVKDPDCLSSGCWSDDCYCEYRENNGGYYSKLGDDDNVYLWSSSTKSDHTNIAWGVLFYYGSVGDTNKDYNYNYVRCVR